MKSLYVLLLALSVSAASCRTKDGAPGPAGESSLSKQGAVSGTITYIDDNGNDATAPFSYEYYESLDENRFSYETYNQSNSYYELNFQRRDLKDANNVLSFEVNGTALNGVESDPTSPEVNFFFLTVINNELYGYGGDDFEITNVMLDHNTGRVTFDFTGTVYDNDDNEATVTGRVDVTLVRLRRNIAV